MIASTIARAMHARTPSISFLGKRIIPKNIDHTPKVHPQSPFSELPKSFAEYRISATQHGPLAPKTTPRASIQPAEGEYFDRNQLPERFWRMKISAREMEIIESGGAAAWA
ncbi:hypothetical protein BZA77DRAFT_287898 [Pyronema omphalodes]|nr:hypothetical protein BZA77DRAFT_287898 [Pyronema omphalodes]